jgi:hypothetical protein
MAVSLNPSLKTIGKRLRDCDDATVHDQLPKRWVELIRRLNELEHNGGSAPENPPSTRRQH